MHQRLCTGLKWVSWYSHAVINETRTYYETKNKHWSNDANRMSLNLPCEKNTTWGDVYCPLVMFHWKLTRSVSEVMLVSFAFICCASALLWSSWTINDSDLRGRHIHLDFKLLPRRIDGDPSDNVLNVNFPHMEDIIHSHASSEAREGTSKTILVGEGHSFWSCKAWKEKSFTRPKWGKVEVWWTSCLSWGLFCARMWRNGTVPTDIASRIALAGTTAGTCCWPRPKSAIELPKHGYEELWGWCG